MSEAASLPSACDVLVVGAGPAGSACAQWLARHGFDVLLADQHTFPRDKVCGDGLIPDAHAALKRLGVHDAVMAEAQRCAHLRCVAPRGGAIDVPGALAVLPRKRLDELLFHAAIDAGAKPLVPWRFAAPLEEGGAVVGARLVHGEAAHTVRARWTVLATGAVPQALIAAGMGTRQTPSGVALRGYLRNDAADIRRLEVAWHPRLAGGYGWIFPAGRGLYNVGVGVSDSHRIGDDGAGRKREVNLRAMFDTFCEVHPPARALVAGGTWTAPLKGAPLRCSLEGARHARPGLLVTGEAAGSTYSFTGEGIGKAMETGLLAAEAICTRGDDAAVRADYESRLAALRPRFELYDRANRINRFPWLADLLVWRAQRSERLVRRMTGVLEETSNPGHLVSAKGIVRLIFG
jgi:geranylgeranyl reductase family protein